MMRTLITHIRELWMLDDGDTALPWLKGSAMKSPSRLSDAWLLIEDQKIAAWGKMTDTLPGSDKSIHASGGMVLPAWCDSHSHLVFSHPREAEFVNRIEGISYEEIARRGGGILNSAQRLKSMDEGALYEQSVCRLQEVQSLGTGAIEIKSGYGLYPDEEMKMLRVIRRLKEQSKLCIKSTFLAGHAYPAEYKNDHEAYLKLVIEETLPRVADEGLAEYIDVFCEEGFFSTDETARILEAGARYGLKAKLHANQLHRSGGVQVGVQHQAVSVDHLEYVEEEEIACLQNSTTIPTLLPGAAFFLRLPFQPARALIDAGLPVALASDYNPGSCPSGNMNFILSLACIQMNMLPEEALTACTLNGAAAMEVADQLGSIRVGKIANLIITKPISSLAYLPYSFGNSRIKKVLIAGEVC